MTGAAPVYYASAVMGRIGVCGVIYTGRGGGTDGMASLDDLEHWWTVDWDLGWVGLGWDWVEMRGVRIVDRI